MPRSDIDWSDGEGNEVSLLNSERELIRQLHGSFSLCKGCLLPWSDNPWDDRGEKPFSVNSVIAQLDRHFQGPVSFNYIGVEGGASAPHNERRDRTDVDKSSRSIPLGLEILPPHSSGPDSPTGHVTVWHEPHCQAHLQLGERIGRGGTWEVYSARWGAIANHSHPSAGKIAVKIAVEAAHGENASKTEEAVRRESQLLAGPLCGLQGDVIPTVYGVYLGTCATPSGPKRAWIMVMEHVGIASTTDHLPRAIQ